MLAEVARARSQRSASSGNVSTAVFSVTCVCSALLHVARAYDSGAAWRSPARSPSQRAGVQTKVLPAQVNPGRVYR